MVVEQSSCATFRHRCSLQCRVNGSDLTPNTKYVIASVLFAPSPPSHKLDNAAELSVMFVNDMHFPQPLHTNNNWRVLPSPLCENILNFVHTYTCTRGYIIFIINSFSVYKSFRGSFYETRAKLRCCRRRRRCRESFKICDI